MNRENRRLLMWPMLSDAVLSYLMLFPAYWLRFYVLRGFRTLPFANYMRVGSDVWR